MAINFTISKVTSIEAVFQIFRNIAGNLIIRETKNFKGMTITTFSEVIIKVITTPSITNRSLKVSSHTPPAKVISNFSCKAKPSKKWTIRQ